MPRQTKLQKLEAEVATLRRELENARPRAESFAMIAQAVIGELKDEIETMVSDAVGEAIDELSVEISR